MLIPPLIDLFFLFYIFSSPSMVQHLKTYVPNKLIGTENMFSTINLEQEKMITGSEQKEALQCQE